MTLEQQFGRSMKVLCSNEMKEAEDALKLNFPQSLQVYGYVFLMNRFKADISEVIVDKWPDFNVLIIKSKQEQKKVLYKDICIFSKDKASLRNILAETNVLDWQKVYLRFDLCNKEMIHSAATSRGVSWVKKSFSHVMKLNDVSKLTVSRLSSFNISSLTESHVTLVNSTWKFNKVGYSEWMIWNMIMNYPSFCVLDLEGQPISWILIYPFCAIGMLYTLPEHRGKGYAKALITIMAKQLHSEGFPVYCLINEGNHLSYRLFSSLGFREDPSYRCTYFEIS